MYLRTPNLASSGDTLVAGASDTSRSPPHTSLASPAIWFPVARESLYRSLSANGNPRLSTLFEVAKAIGLKLTVEAK